MKSDVIEAKSSIGDGVPVARLTRSNFMGCILGLDRGVRLKTRQVLPPRWPSEGEEKD